MLHKLLSHIWFHFPKPNDCSVYDNFNERVPKIVKYVTFWFIPPLMKNWSQIHVVGWQGWIWSDPCIPLTTVGQYILGRASIKKTLPLLITGTLWVPLFAGPTDCLCKSLQEMEPDMIWPVSGEGIYKKQGQYYRRFFINAWN